MSWIWFGVETRTVAGEPAPPMERLLKTEVALPVLASASVPLVTANEPL